MFQEILFTNESPCNFLFILFGSNIQGLPWSMMTACWVKTMLERSRGAGLLVWGRGGGSQSYCPPVIRYHLHAHSGVSFTGKVPVKKWHLAVVRETRHQNGWCSFMETLYWSIFWQFLVKQKHFEHLQYQQQDCADFIISQVWNH